MVIIAAAVFSAALFSSCGENSSPTSPGNAPPNNPHSPQPADSSEYTREYLTASWESSDPDGDEVIYTVQVRENDNFIAFAGQTTLKTMDTGLFLLRETMYTWRVTATDGAVDIQATSVHLSWSADDPDQSDVLTYTVFFGTNDDPELVAAGLTETSYALPQLDYDTEYFWYVVSNDSHDESTSGPIWTFTSRSQPSGFLQRIGELLERFVRTPSASVITPEDS